MRKSYTYLAFIALSLAGGLLIGYIFRAGSWYAALEKPVFNPPGWVFAPVWTVLYILIGIAGARVFLNRSMPLPRAAAIRGLWIGLLALNFMWTPLFFGLQWPAVALGVVALLFAGIVAFIIACWSRDRTAAWLFVPYAAWIGFATVLNAAIVVLNR